MLLFALCRHVLGGAGGDDGEGGRWTDMQLARLRAAQARTAAAAADFWDQVIGLRRAIAETRAHFCMSVLFVCPGCSDCA